MLTIGRFADASGLTVKALRHYDEVGLFAPAHIDADTGYRYYDESQVEDAVAIRRLRLFRFQDNPYSFGDAQVERAGKG